MNNLRTHKNRKVMIGFILTGLFLLLIPFLLYPRNFTDKANVVADVANVFHQYENSVENFGLSSIEADEAFKKLETYQQKGVGLPYTLLVSLSVQRNDIDMAGVYLRRAFMELPNSELAPLLYGLERYWSPETNQSLNLMRNQYESHHFSFALIPLEDSLVQQFSQCLEFFENRKFPNFNFFLDKHFDRKSCGQSS